MTSHEARVQRLERELWLWRAVVAVFIVAHLPVLALLPKLVGGESAPVIVALVLTAVALAILVTRRR